MSVLKAFERTSTTEDIVVALRAAITTGEIAQGTQLREAALAKELGVGRAPVREALRQLVQEGLVTYEVHRGSFVKVLTVRDLVDIYVARQGIEARAVQLILEAGEGVDLSGVEAALDELRSAPGGERPTGEIVVADIALHEAIVEASGSPRLQRMFRTLSAETRMYLLQAHPPYDSETYVEDHERLVAGIVERSPDAPLLMYQHLESSLEVIRAGMDESTDRDGS